MANIANKPPINPTKFGIFSCNQSLVGELLRRAGVGFLRGVVLALVAVGRFLVGVAISTSSI